LLGWSQEALAEVSGVSIPTIKRLEAADGELGGLPVTQAKIISCLEKARIQFTNNDEPGVKLRRANRKAKAESKK
jgi:transcriptional regulator with XRE-family HTH domain